MNEFSEVENLVNRYPILINAREDILKAEKMIVSSYEQGGKLLVCGNGGSASDADHIVGELMKEFHRERPLPEIFKKTLKSFDEEGMITGQLKGALPAISLNAQNAIMTAIINDCDPEIVYAQQVYAYGACGDVLLGMSTSGNSKNIKNAVITAKALGMKTILLTGEKGGNISDIVDISIKLPETDTYLVQELTLPVYHAICIMIEDHFWG